MGCAAEAKPRVLRVGEDVKVFTTKVVAKKQNSEVGRK